MEEITIKDEFIKLGQALKLSGLAENGADAKNEILDGSVSVNGEKEYKRGRKLYDGDIFSYNGSDVRVISLMKGEI